MRISKVRGFLPAPEDGKDGDNAINVIVTNENIVFTGIAKQRVYVEVLDGQKQVEYDVGSGFICSTLEESGQEFHYICGGNVRWDFGIDGNRFYYELILFKKTDINQEIRFTVTYKGVKYSRSINISTAFDGVGISDITEYYLATSAATDVTTDTSGWTTGIQTVTAEKKYLWNYETVTYTDGTSKDTTPVIIGVYGDKGVGVSSITEYYLATSAATDVTTDTSGWTTGIQTVTAEKKYLWNYETVTYTDGTSKNTTPVIIGAYGDDGNGIKSQTNYYIATTLKEGVTPSNPSSGWVAGVFQPPQALKPYAWRFTRTVYTKTGTVDSPCELIATFQGGTNPNLLDATTFESLESMGKAWDVINQPAMQSGTYNETVSDGILAGDKGYQGRNAFRGGTLYSLESLKYKEILRQPVVSKLKPSTWYTLSYWTRSLADSLFYENMTSHLYGFCKYKLYLQAEHTYYAQINGFVSTAAKNAGRSLRAYIYGLKSNGDWAWSTVLEIDKTSSDMKSVTFSVPATGVYYITFYSYHSSGTSGTTAQTVTVERCYIRDWNVISTAHIFPGIIDTDVKGFVDGAETKLAEDGAVQLAAGGWTYHTYTFKTKAVLPVDSLNKIIEQYILFRLLPGVVTSKMTNISGQSDVSTTSHGLTYAEICMPKLEEGLVATGYIPSNKDLKGDRGPALRGPQNWEDVPVGFQFQSGGDGDLYFDTVIYGDNYYNCHKNHTKTANNFPTSTTSESQELWKLGDKFDIVATKLLLATYALIKNLGVEAVDMKDSEGNILFQVKDGDVVCKTGTFENVTIKGKLKGSVRNPFVAAGDSFDTDYSDNVVLISEGGGWVNGYSLPWDVGQSGRRITLVNYKWGDVLSQGFAGISAPSGKYFYMNGIQKTTLNISREAVELLGYGTTTAFYGWIVLRRIDLVTTYRYGRELKALALGTVTGSNSGASISYKTFDGSALYVSRQGVGIYKITMPSGWFAAATDCKVILTGVGDVFDHSGSPVKATLYSRSTTDIIVHTSDDDSKNDGTFDFIISNGNDWTI